MKKIILLVEQEIDEVDDYKEMLQAKNFDVLAVRSYEEALDQISANPEKYDLLLAYVDDIKGDYEIPGFVNKVRQRFDIPIVLMPYLYNNTARMLKQQGKIQDFIDKPFSFYEFVEKIKTVLSEAG